MAEVALNSVLHYNCWLWFYLWEYENQCYSGVEFTVCFGRGERENSKKGHQHNSFYSANKLYVRRLKWDEMLFAPIVEEGTFFISYTWRDCHLVLGVCFFFFFFNYYGFLVGHMLVSSVVHFLLPEFCSCHFEKWKEVVYLFVKKKKERNKNLSVIYNTDVFLKVSLHSKCACEVCTDKGENDVKIEQITFCVCHLLFKLMKHSLESTTASK